MSSITLQVNSEFYTGWLDHWGDQHAVVDAQKVSRVLGEMLTMGASVNMYVSTNPQSFLCAGYYCKTKSNSPAQSPCLSSQVHV